MHVQFNDTVNIVYDTAKLENDTVLDLIKQNNKITATEISKKLNIILSTAKRRLKKLKDNQIIKRIGSDKTGYWKNI